MEENTWLQEKIKLIIDKYNYNPENFQKHKPFIDEDSLNEIVELLRKNE